MCGWPFYHKNIHCQQQEITSKTIMCQSQNNPKSMKRNMFKNQLHANHETITGQSQEFLLLEKAFGTVYSA